ncbi:MAG: zinc ABC transporter substrate-binding protein [Pseudomonadota bacterium]|nr:zinc ABC transporter substrate-binding protein [Pseudomonadota bacterium]
MKIKYTPLIALTLLLTSGLIRPSAAMEGIVVTIKPIHSLVSSITKGVSKPYLIIRGTSSPHTYSLRPSDAKKIRRAKIVFRVDNNLENFLIKSIKTLGREARIVTLSETNGLTKLKYRDLEDFKSSHKGHNHHKGHDDHKGHKGHEGHHHEGTDLHLWLDPKNAIRFVHKIEAKLKQADPKNAETYRVNAVELRERLTKLTKTIKSQLKSLKRSPFIVFHDAYQYYENRFGLKAAGTITLNHEVPPSVKQISTIKKRLKILGAACIFQEPQFNQRISKAVARGTGTKILSIDPLGAAIEPGPGMYNKLLEDITTSFKNCLSN